MYGSVQRSAGMIPLYACAPSLMMAQIASKSATAADHHVRTPPRLTAPSPRTMAITVPVPVVLDRAPITGHVGARRDVAPIIVASGPSHLCQTGTAWTQQPAGRIGGRGTDGATEQPLAAATVTVGGRNARTTVDGRYLIPGLAAGSYTLNARLIGYASASQPVTVAGGDTVVVDLAMTRQAVGLSEVVVTGYGQQLAGNVTGAQSQVNAQDFNTGTNASPQQLIANKVAGLQIVDNNEPGRGLAVRIRGHPPLNAALHPLSLLPCVPLGTGSGGGVSRGPA